MITTTAPSPAGKATNDYAPKFPNTYAKLLTVYEKAMTLPAAESVIWCERFKALTISLEALKKDGVLPSLFTQTFHEDIQDVMKKVNPGLELRALTEQQGLMTFGISSLRMMFGGR